MLHNNGEKNSDPIEEQNSSSPAHKLRSKRQMSDSPAHTLQPQNKGNPTTKRVKNAELFKNPWRCDSDTEPYEPLPITYHKPIYNPPCYFSQDLKHLSKSQQALKIMSYHYALSGQMSLCARSQPHHVLLGDPVQGSQLFNGSLEKKKVITASDILCDQVEPYVSRSGRHIKRRQNLQCDISDDDDTDKEKSAKKIKLQSNKDEGTKSTPVAKKLSRKLTNDEIMSRSSLFADSPVVNKSSRTAAMFNKLEQSEKETQKAEMEKRKFEKTLEPGSDDDIEVISSSNDEAIRAVEDEDNNFIRRRIVPPMPNKKGKNTVNKPSELPSTSTSSATDDNDFVSLRNTQIKNLNGNSGSQTPSSNKRGPKKKMTGCPICGESFATKEIEEHASTCGLTNELEIESSLPNQRSDNARY